MKTWKKVLLIISGITACLGITCIIVGLVLGVDFKKVTSLVSQGYFSLGHSWYSWNDDFDENWDEDSFYDSQMNTSSTEIEFTDIKNIEVKMNFGQISMEEYDGQKIKVEAENVNKDKYYMKQDGDTLVIRDESKRYVSGSRITVYIPQNSKFDEVNLDISAGEAILASLDTREFKAEIGAGRLDIDGRISANEADIHVDAGQIAIQNMASADVELECGVGQISVTMEGSKSDYRLDADCGVGEIQFGDDSYASLSKKVRDGDGSKIITAECGAGQIDIEFEANN